MVHEKVLTELGQNDQKRKDDPERLWGKWYNIHRLFWKGEKDQYWILFSIISAFQWRNFKKTFFSTPSHQLIEWYLYSLLNRLEAAIIRLDAANSPSFHRTVVHRMYSFFESSEECYERKSKSISFYSLSTKFFVFKEILCKNWNKRKLIQRALGQRNHSMFLYLYIADLYII